MTTSGDSEQEESGEQVITFVRPSRRTRFRTSPFEAAFSVCAVVSGTFNIVSRASIQQSNLNTVVPLWWAYGINGGYAVGGALALAGIWTGKPAVEASGLIALATFLAINALVITEVRGLAALSSIAIYVAIASACVWRALILRKPLPVQYEVVTHGR